MPPHDQLPPGGIRVGDVDGQWDAWRPEQAAARLAPVTAPWCVAGGWALDMCRAEQTRDHHDLEIAVPAHAFPQIRRALAGCDFEAVGSGRLWPVGSLAFERTHQTWASEPDPRRARGRVYRLDVFREPTRAGRWVYRRNEQITLPYERVIRRDTAGIPYLVPEIVLLFKANRPRDKDQADFAAALPLLTSAGAAWLRAVLRQVHPGHAWVEAL